MLALPGPSEAKIGARPAGASQRHQRPSSLLRDKKGEDPRVVGGGQKSWAWAGGEQERERARVREEREQGDNG